MASPVDAGRAATNVSTAAVTHTVNLPATPAVGDLLVYLSRVPAGSGYTMPSGWTELVDETQAATSSDRMCIAYKKLVGGDAEIGASTMSVTVDAATARTGAHIVWRITGAVDPATQAPQLSTEATGTVAAVDPGTVTPTGGSKDYLFLWLGGWEGEQTSPPSGTPSGYSNAVGADTGTAGAVATNARVAGASKQATASSENAPTWTLNVADDWNAYVMAIHPGPPAATGSSTVRGGGGAVAAATKAGAGSSSSRGGGGAVAAASSQRFGSSSCRSGGSVTSVGQKDEAGLLTPTLDATFTGAASSTYTFDQPVAAEARVLLAVHWFDTSKTLTGGSDNDEGLTWEVIRQHTPSSPGHRLAIVTAYAPNGLADNTVFTPTWSGGGSPAFGPEWIGSSWLNLAETSYVEDQDSQDGFDSTWAVPALTVAGEKTLVYAAGYAPFFSSGGAHAATSPYTELHEFAFGDERLVDVYDVVESSAAGNYTPGGTWSGGGGIAMQIEVGVAFVPASGAGAPDVQGTSSIRGGGAVSSSGAKNASGSSSVRGGSRAFATAAKQAAGTSSVRGGGTGVAAGQEGGLGGTGVSGGGGVTSSVRKNAFGSSSVRGGGTITGTGTSETPPPNVNGTSSVRGGGRAASSGIAGRSSSSSVRSGGRLFATSSASRASSSTVRSGGRLFATASGQRRDASSVSAGGRLFASSSSSRSATSSVRGGGFVTSTASSIPPATPAITSSTRAGPARGRTRTSLDSGITRAGSSTGGTGTMLEEG